MIRVIEWAAVIMLWLVAVAFVGSDILCILAMIHHRKDREMLVVFAGVTLMFAMIGAGAVYAALMVGRCL